MESKLADKSWTDTKSEEDIKFLSDVKDMSENLISQVYIFIEYFHQYVDAVQASAIFSTEYAEQFQENAQVYPTQTSGAPAGPTPANRAERRASKKSRLIVP